jgi:D-aminopeptidase
MANGSGDFVIAFSTANRIPHAPSGPVRKTDELENEAASPLFLAAVESVEEAVYNSLTRATTVAGYRGAKAEALPVERVKELLTSRR